MPQRSPYRDDAYLIHKLMFEYYGDRPDSFLGNSYFCFQTNNTNLSLLATYREHSASGALDGTESQLPELVRAVSMLLGREPCAKYYALGGEHEGLDILYEPEMPWQNKAHFIFHAWNPGPLHPFFLQRLKKQDNMGLDLLPGGSVRKIPGAFNRFQSSPPF